MYIYIYIHMYPLDLYIYIYISCMFVYVVHGLSVSGGRRRAVRPDGCGGQVNGLLGLSLRADGATTSAPERTSLYYQRQCPQTHESFMHIYIGCNSMCSWHLAICGSVPHSTATGLLAFRETCFLQRNGAKS